MEEKNIGAEELERCRAVAERCRTEARKRLVGQERLVDGILTALVAGGHVLLEGVPGLAKTLAVRTFSEISGLDFKRIQFTPDLLPADVSGTLMYEPNKGAFSVRKGPIFTNVVLADEINRAPAKVQSAMLEAMEERQVTIGEESYKLAEPFFVLATQNPVEQEGTYNLPEAELDRFLMKLVVGYPSAEEEVQIVKTMGRAAEIPVARALSAADLKLFKSLVPAVVCDDAIAEYIVKIVSVTRPSAGRASEHDVTRYIALGASPRAGISLLQCARSTALLAGRSFVLPEDIKAVALPVLRHRLVLSYEAASDGVGADEIIGKILDFVPLP
ncbi:MAG: AAA family ATPase [Treponemataceae bacterium]|nr:AAA family ATPase [Treponemataceae bacterium]